MYRNVSDTFLWSVMPKMKENISAGQLLKLQLEIGPVMGVDIFCLVGKI